MLRNERFGRSSLIGMGAAIALSGCASSEARREQDALDEVRGKIREYQALCVYIGPKNGQFGPFPPTTSGKSKPTIMTEVLADMQQLPNVEVCGHNIVRKKEGKIDRATITMCAKATKHTQKIVFKFVDYNNRNFPLIRVEETTGSTVDEDYGPGCKAGPGRITPRPVVPWPD